MLSRGKGLENINFEGPSVSPRLRTMPEDFDSGCRRPSTPAGQEAKVGKNVV